MNTTATESSPSWHTRVSPKIPRETDLFEAILGRWPDAGGWMHWTTPFVAGMENPLTPPSHSHRRNSEPRSTGERSPQQSRIWKYIRCTVWAGECGVNCDF